MQAVRLPISGIDVSLWPPVGLDELALLEAPALDLTVAVALLQRLVVDDGPGPVEVADLPLGDIDALMLRLRQRVVGDVIRAESRCPAPGCGELVDVSFSIADYLAHHAPELPDDVEAAEEPGWYRLRHGGVSFRPPTARDELSLADPAPAAGDTEEALLERCAPGVGPGTPDREAIEAALERLAPDLCGELSGSCVECGAPVTPTFDPTAFTLGELRDRAAPLFEEVARIARSFHWSEAAILALPAMRRERYADLVGPSPAGERGPR